MSNNPYKAFDNFVVRSPAFSMSFYKDLTSELEIDNLKFEQIFDQLFVQESIYIASPALYEELLRWRKGAVTDLKKVEKLKETFLKYLSRMSSRCTPFGLFAGCSVGKWDDKTNLKRSNSTEYIRKTRLDMNYLVALSQDLTRQKEIRNQLIFSSNTTLYEVGDQLRYVEYKYLLNKRVHQISAVKRSIYIDKIIQNASVSEGMRLQNLAELLVDKDVSYEDALNFVNELVDNQVLISELEPSVSGSEFLEQILSVLIKLQGVNFIVNTLNKVKELLLEIDLNVENSFKNYNLISEFLKALETELDMKFLFQTDLIIKLYQKKLDSSIIDSVKRGMVLLNKITIPSGADSLSLFKKAFYERFGGREVSLSKALDVEMGIRYNQGKGTFEFNPLIDDLVLPQLSNSNIKVWNQSSIDLKIQSKILKANNDQSYSIELFDTEFDSYECNWSDLPDTMSTIVEIVNIGGKQKIKFANVGGASAANILARFGYADEKIKEIIQEITDFEEKANPNKISAEILHLPESRIGNILMRPRLREFEIPYLAKSLLIKENQLPISDLTISIVDDEIYLKSQSHNKQVVPYHTNAHNYLMNSLPIYNFLCEMQFNKKRSFLGFNFNSLIEEHGFLPRIEYGDLILSEALWYITKSELIILQKSKSCNEQLHININEFIKEKKIPQFVLISEGDNELLVNFKNLTSVRMFLEVVKNRPSTKLIEFLHGEINHLLTDDLNEYYTNQFVLSFFNSERIQHENRN